MMMILMIVYLTYFVVEPVDHEIADPLVSAGVGEVSTVLGGRSAALEFDWKKRLLGDNKAIRIYVVISILSI